jgi:hypothetical protein
MHKKSYRSLKSCNLWKERKITGKLLAKDNKRDYNFRAFVFITFKSRSLLCKRLIWKSMIR